MLLASACSGPAQAQESVFPELSGWQLTPHATVYDSTNLWDIIDGGADLYLHYGFGDLHIGRYAGPDNMEIKVEVYRHKSATLAFGIYAQERDTSYDFVDVGIQGYAQEGILNFLCGRYYVKVSTHQRGEKAQRALRHFAQEIAHHLHQNTSWPAMLMVFPGNGRIPNSEQFLPQNFLGMRSLHSAFVASYRRGFRMFVIDAETPLHANTILEACLQEGSTDARRPIFRTPENNSVQIAVLGRYVYGIVDCDDRRVREMYMKELRAALRPE